MLYEVAYYFEFININVHSSKCKLAEDYYLKWLYASAHFKYPHPF
jgi:hypothetical protein